MPDGSPHSSTVVIRDRTLKIVGGGVLVGPREVLTCAHVVNAALGLNKHTQRRPGAWEQVTVSFPLLDDGGGPRTTFPSTVRVWRPPPLHGATDRDDVAGEDIAGLTIGGDLPDDAVRLPAGARPARLAAEPPRVGRAVRIFGYPTDPPREDGSWVDATVRGILYARLQLDSRSDAGLKVQPGYSGFGVYDEAAGAVVGIVVAAPPGNSRESDFRAIGTDRLRDAWPAKLPRRSPVHGAADHSDITGVDRLTVLHLSELGFGRPDEPGGHAAEAFRRLPDDVERIAREAGQLPDLIVVTGDLTHNGYPTEFAEAFEYIGAVAAAFDVDRHNVAVVPGTRDLNLQVCQAYFLEMAGQQEKPQPPYFPKWRYFRQALEQFHPHDDQRTDAAGRPLPQFGPAAPWSLFEVVDPDRGLKVVVAGLNSTFAESHRDADRFGALSLRQLQWFQKRLAWYREHGWLRIAAVHHNVAGRARAQDNLHDASDLDTYLGEPRLVNLVLHGHTDDSRIHWLSSGLPLLSTGTAARDTPGGAPLISPNHCQLVTVTAGTLGRSVLRYEATAPGRWVGDTRATSTGSDWRDSVPHAFDRISGTFRRSPAASPAAASPPPADAVPPAITAPREDLLGRVEEIVRVHHPGAMVFHEAQRGYLLVTARATDGPSVQWPVGVHDGDLTPAALEAFADEPHALYRGSSSRDSEFVYSGSRAPDELVAYAHGKNIRLSHFSDYRRLIDLRPLVARQTARLSADRRYPPELYLPQRFRLLDPASDGSDDLADAITTWLREPDACFVMVLGDFGRGKTALLRRLARTLPEALDGALPVLIELRDYDKGPPLDEILSLHLLQQDVEDINLRKVRYMIQRGRIVLLLDGFDEFELRVGYDSAAAYLQTLQQAVKDQAKIVLTSRTQQFRSTAQVRTALGDRLASMRASRIVLLEDFTPGQIRRFLTNLYGGDEAAARTRFALLERVTDLFELARNPRMLGFIAELGDGPLREIAAAGGTASPARLYARLIERWLTFEQERLTHTTGPGSLLADERREACTTLALRMSKAHRLDLSLDELADVAATLTDLAGRAYSPEHATHAVGSGTLLVRAEDGTFSFIHRSVMEWFLADAAARELTGAGPGGILTGHRLPQQSIEFFCDLADHDRARAWSAGVLADDRSPDAAKHNALDVNDRLGFPPPQRQELAGVDLRGERLVGRRLRGADLRGARLGGAVLQDVDLAGANLEGADLVGARLVGGSLRGARLHGSRWQRAALVGTDGWDDVVDDGEPPALSVAAVADRDEPTVNVPAGGLATCVAYAPKSPGAGPEQSLLAVGRGATVELVALPERRILRVLAGHTGTVTGLAFSRQGLGLLVTASRDGTAVVWDLATGSRTRDLTGHADGVTDVAIDAGGRIATASRDGLIRVWEPGADEPATILGGHTSGVSAVTFSNDGTRLASASWDCTARVWDARTGEQKRVIVGHTEVTSVAFSPDDKLIATASFDGEARIYDTAGAARDEPRMLLHGHKGVVNAVVFSPDRRFVATASNDKAVFLWNLQTGAVHTRLEQHGSWVTGVAFEPVAGEQIATAAHDWPVRLWNTSAKSDHPPEITSRNNWVTAAHFDPASGTPRLAAVANRTARLWNLADGSMERLVGSHPTALSAVAYARDGTLVATASSNGDTWLWDAGTGEARGELPGDGGHVNGLAFSADGTRLAIAADDRAARVWRIADPGDVLVLPDHGGAVTGVAFCHGATRQADARLATSSEDGRVRLFDARTGRLARVLAEHEATVTAVAFSPDGARIASASWDGSAVLRNLDGSERVDLTGHAGGVTAIAHSGAGDRVATGSSDTTAQIWTLAGGAPLVLRGHAGTVTQVAFSPDGSVLATAAEDNTLRLWRVRDGSPVATLLGLPGEDFAVLLPDGSYKLRGAASGALWWAVKLCRFEPGELDGRGVRRLPDDHPLDLRARPA